MYPSLSNRSKNLSTRLSVHIHLSAKNLLEPLRVLFLSALWYKSMIASDSL